VFKAIAVASLAALASVVAVAMPASAATVTVTITVPNATSATLADVYLAPDKWVSMGDLQWVDYGTFNETTKVFTFEGVPANSKVLVALDSLGQSNLVDDYWVGQNHGYAYPLVTPAQVNASALNLGSVSIPAPGKVEVKASSAVVKGSATRLHKVNGDLLWDANPTVSGGVTTFSGLVPGKYVVVYDGNSNYLGKTVGTVTVKAGETTSITNAPKKASKITGKVTTTKGKAIKGVQVYASSKNASSYATTDSKGKYTLGGLPAGTYKVTFGYAGASHAAGKYASKTVTVKSVKAGSSKSAGTVKLSVGATVSGTLAFTGASARVIAVNSKGEYVAAVDVTKKKKSYKLQGLPKGKYKVYVVETKFDKPKMGVVSATLTAGKTTKTKKISANKATLTLSGKISGPGAANANIYISGGVWGSATANSSGAYKVTGLVPGKYWVSVFAGSNGGQVGKAITVSKSVKKNFALPAVSSVTFTHAGKPIVGAEIDPFWSTTDANGTAKLAWSADLKGAEPNVYADHILGYSTPFYFTLNKAKLNSKADMTGLKVTGIGGQ